MRPKYIRELALFAVGLALLGIVELAGAGPPPPRLSRFTESTFEADGEIFEFIFFPGNPQEYFIVDPILEDPVNRDYGAIKVGAVLTRGVAVTRDNRPAPGFSNQAGQSGFRDRPGSVGEVFVPTGFNIGRVFASYNPDAYGGEGAYFLAMDISAPARMDSKSETQPVAFDVDGDGSRITQTEINPGALSEAPKVDEDRYTFGVDSTRDGLLDVRVIISERREAMRIASIPIDPAGGPQVIDGVQVRRTVQFEDRSGQLMGTPKEWAVDFLDSSGDGVIDRFDFGIGSDIELVIRNVRGLPGPGNPACPEFFFTADSFDDELLGGGAEELVRLRVVFPIPDIEAVKKVRCADDVDAPFESHARATPGSTLEFEISVQNHGNVDLDVFVDDVMSCAGVASLTPIASSCQVVAAPKDFDSAAFCAELDAALANPDLFPLDIGTLRAAEPCALLPGESLVVRFQALVGPAAHQAALCDQEIDCRNGVSVTGLTTRPVDLILPPHAPSPDSPNGDAEEEDCDLPACCNGIAGCIANDGFGDVADEFNAVVRDQSGAVDTPRERLVRRDDNEATVEVECRRVQLTKEVGLSPSGPFQSGTNALQLPAAPLDIVYRFTATNQGETSETITLSEGAFCEDLAALGTTFPGQVVLMGCPLCEPPSPGELTATIPAEGSPFQTTCTVRVTTEAALTAFMRADDGRPGCRASTPDRGPDDKCYRNCAAATAALTSSNGICPGAEVRADSLATICHDVCEIEVTKTARCLNNCTDRNPADPMMDPLPALPGSCLEFEIQARNMSADTPICLLRINDVMSHQPADIVFDGGVRFSVDGMNCTVPPECLDADGISCDWTPASCGLTGLGPMQTLTIRFHARVPVGANPTQIPQNVVTIDGAALCPTTGPALTCRGQADAAVDILAARLTCVEKEWEVQTDTDADCVPDGDFEPGGDEVDLSEELFPVRLRLRIKATNTGNVSISATATDAVLSSCVASTPGVNFAVSPACQLGTAKIIPPGGMAEWTCEVLVDSADAMRALDACDTVQDNAFRNAARVAGTIDPNATGFCRSGLPAVECPGSLTTPLLAPPECEVTVNKDVKCQGAMDSAYSAELQALPGAKQTFRLRIANTSDDVKIPQICLTDALNCRTWLLAGSVTVRVGGDNLSACLGPAVQAALTSGNRTCIAFDTCRPATPWLAPMETMIVTFDVAVPGDFSTVGAEPDCVNELDVEAYDNACEETPPANEACSTGSGSARFDVLVPAVKCDKAVCVDLDNDGSCDRLAGSSISVPVDVEFPFTLIYRFIAYNQGETPLADVLLCDEDLVADAAAAGLVLPVCQLSGGCSSPEFVPEMGQITQTCRVQIPNRHAWMAFAQSDADDDENCYSNSASAVAIVDSEELCDGSGPIVIRSGDCSSQACLPPPPTGACCRRDGACTIATEEECTEVGNTYLGNNVPCAGDSDGNGIDDACEQPIPTVSAWGLACMIFFFLIAVKVRSRNVDWKRA